MQIEVLFADASLIVANKPSGLLSVPGRGDDKQDCLSRRIQAEFADALVVHRLDMSTSGLLLMARGAQVQRELGHSFAMGLVRKRYLAVVSGQYPDTGEAGLTIDLPIGADWSKRPLRQIDWAAGKPSQTLVHCIGRDAHSNTSRVEMEPLTGRTHQLRVHMQAMGHPILGDALYAPQTIAAQASRLLLHAQALAFKHPYSGTLMTFDCPADF